MTDIRILLVDDEEFYLRLFSDILASRRYYVRTAKSGEEAMELLGSDHFDLLITDLLMPGIDGLELTRMVREQYAWMDIIVITQRDDVRLAVKSMRMGVFEYLVKPIDRDELLLTLDRLLERRRLVDQQNKLIDESMQYLEAQTVYRRCLDILSTLDFENLCEMILRHMLQATGSQGAMLWLTSPDGRSAADGGDRLNLTAYRGLVSLDDFPSSINMSQGEYEQPFRDGEPFFAAPWKVLGMEEQSTGRAEALFIPLVVDGVPVGLLLLLDKLREDFTERDQNIASTMAEFSAIALKNARRYQALERVGLKDPTSTAYNLTYFIDYAGKEIYKARRYSRSFSLVTVVIDRFEFLREHFKSEICGQMSRKLAESISRVVRDSDILARVSDSEYYVLLPETDSLGARMFIRRSQETFRTDSFISQMSRDYPVSVTLGAATFPLDGADFDELLVACRDRMERSRESLFRRLRLGERGFWDAVRILVGRQDEHVGSLEQASESFRLAEDAEGGNAHIVLREEILDAIEGAVCSEAVDSPDSKAILYALGGVLGREPRPVETALADAERARAFVIGRRGEDARVSEQPSVTRIFLDEEPLDQSRMLLVLSERVAYAMLGERGEDGRVFGFHSRDAHLVENLIALLQEHYNLQRQY
ncbi:MAG: response regulator [Deltaproteobacteria bacterium]|nr:response regulator [Deltaproteobacteria bacterium]